MGKAQGILHIGMRTHIFLFNPDRLIPMKTSVQILEVSTEPENCSYLLGRKL